MFYEIVKDAEKALSAQQLDLQTITMGYVDLKTLKTIYDLFGFAESTVTECETRQNHFRSNIEIYDDYTFGKINIINLNSIESGRDHFAFYIKKNLFLIVELQDMDGSTRAVFDYSLTRFKPENVTLEKVIYGFFERLLYGDYQFMEHYGNKISDMETELAYEKPDRKFNLRILDMKKELLVMRNYYDQLVDIGEELQGNENEIFDDGNLRYFKIYSDKTCRFSENTQMLMENLNHVKEAYESALEYDLNTIMKVFTIVTVIFLPLTLLVGWYGMNFSNMPELSWKYGYPVVIGFSILIVIMGIYFFKKKKLL